MATPVTMPQLGYDMTEGAVQNWLKKEGDEVKKGEPIAEIETDKSTIEMEAFAGGVLKKIIVEPGKTVPVGSVIAVIGDANEEIDYKALGVDAPGSASTPAVAAKPQAQAPAPPAAAPVAASNGQQPAPELAASVANKPVEPTSSVPGALTDVKPETRLPTGAPAKRATGASLINLAAPIAATGGPGGAPVAEETGGAAPASAAAPVRSDVAPQTAPAQQAATQAPAAPKAVSGTVVSTGPDGRIKSSPLARKTASEMGVDLGQVSGTGPNGRIVRADVENYASSGAAVAAPRQPAPAVGEAATVAAQAPAQPEAAVVASEPGADYTDIPASRMRQTIARRLLESKQQIPHFYVSTDVDMTEALKLRGQINKSLEGEGVKITVNDIVMVATAKTLTKFPGANASWQGNAIRQHNRINLAMAVTVPDGLITPVIFDADKKSISQVSKEARALADKARAGKLRPEEFQGGTFSVSNLGMYDVTSFIAVINPPQAAILAVASVKPTVVLKSGSPEDGTAEYGVEQRMTVTISGDHRVVDGSLAAQFLQEFKRLLESPMLLLV
jgi:pyruvate dehydrogenase E2 component (dihydrolipoamide acetyltransferase)